MQRFIIISSGLVLGLVAASCAPKPEYFPWEDHCANQDGNAWCVERYDDGSIRVDGEVVCEAELMCTMRTVS